MERQVLKEVRLGRESGGLKEETRGGSACKREGMTSGGDKAAEN
jgi:hypothetical protein